MDKLTYTLAHPEDIQIIFNLAEKIWQHHYTPIIGAVQVSYMLSKMYSAETLTEQMKEQGHKFYLIYLKGNPIGFIAISGDIDLFIHKFYIDQDVQNKGIGSDVFHWLKSENSMAETISLTVNRKNYKSINFYFKLGFIIDHIDDFDIGQGFFMNDFIMKWTKK